MFRNKTKVKERGYSLYLSFLDIKTFEMKCIMCSHCRPLWALLNSNWTTTCGPVAGSIEVISVIDHPPLRNVCQSEHQAERTSEANKEQCRRIHTFHFTASHVQSASWLRPTEQIHDAVCWKVRYKSTRLALQSHMNWCNTQTWLMQRCLSFIG